MAIATPNNLPPVTDEAFLADRQKFWASLCSATTVCIIAMAILLSLMAFFLT